MRYRREDVVARKDWAVNQGTETASVQIEWAPGAIVSPICLGTAPFGSDVDTRLSLSFIDAYVEGGGNFFDTAHVYGAWRDGCEGASERTVGAWIRTNGGREKLIVSTKGGHPPMSDFTASRCSRKALYDDLEESLERLGLDYVDLYFLHRDDRTMPVSELIEVVSEFLERGLIRAYAASNWTSLRMEEANIYARRSGRSPFVASQVGWSLAKFPGDSPPLPGMRYLDDAARTWHHECAMPLIPFSSQAQGYFGRENVLWATSGFEGPPPLALDYDCSRNRGRLVRASELSREKECTANQVALAYLRAQPFPVIPVIGALEKAHVVEALESASVVLSRQECEYLEHGNR